MNDASTTWENLTPEEKKKQLFLCKVTEGGKDLTRFFYVMTAQ
jgi:hypothetical protein